MFSGVGFFKGYEFKLHVDELVKPDAQEKVDAKLDEFLELDTIEEVPEGPSRLILPLVVVPQGNGDIRVCAELMKQLIVREWHPIIIPTVKELWHDLNGSIVFSKIDLKWGFHQILLSEGSRNYTFVTY